ncbi:4-hydroxyphenylacetate 3-monooxygenase, reductase component [Pseudomonas oryzihabitans]|uniref:4-hydroxyphenylacetate 3-monooxygenase, reductase component n=1 Tax=Pseudomonas TaxID=286 RepID=UPI00135D9B55|nr:MULTISPECIES: 4-hydroxyphenylacetate 3-monooxygenase, reductase component [Pseudomonas]MXS18834.1 4-hydroxyphenylacetate 3-monooxygenase, reductase component [Pseudomonas oryzihabitans]UUW72695.1 4-hydroxyphenylacetate 3-monooxygenase, reductase component [Pseudomonas psychrotolerans]
MNALTPVQQAFRNAMAALSAAVNVITTDGPGGRCGITATAVCSVTDSPPTLLVCVNRSSAMNAVFKTNARLCVNVLAGEHEEVARHFAGMTGVDMDERFARHAWGRSAQGLPLLEDALASLQGRIVETQEVGTHSVFLVELDEIATREHCTGLVYFGRHFHQLQPVSAA